MKDELENLIAELTANFERTIQEDNEKNEIIEAFRNYLYLAVQTIQESTSKFISKDPESIKSVLNSIARNYENMDIDAIKRTLLIDNAFDEIRKKSLEIFEIAKSNLSGKTNDANIDVENEVKNMQTLLKEVKEYNKEQAQELISEAIIDSGYITNSNEDILSLRLYHFKELMNKDKEGR